MLNYTLKGNNSGNLIDNIFINRGITNKDLIFNPKETSKTSPFIYDNMELGIITLNKYINRKLLILVDSDTDGFCSAAEMYLGIKSINPDANVKYLIHNTKAHGLTPEIMEQVMEINPDLLIIPDAGSNDYEQHKILLDNLKLMFLNSICQKIKPYKNL